MSAQASPVYLCFRDKGFTAIFLACLFLFFLSQAIAYAEPQLIWDTDKETTPSSRIEDPEKDLKEIEEYLLKIGNGKWEMGNGEEGEDLTDKLSSIRLFLEISKRRDDRKGLKTALRGIRSLPKDRKNIKELTTLAMLYLDAYMESQEPFLKTEAEDILKTIEGLWEGGLKTGSVETPIAAQVAITFFSGGELLKKEYRDRGIETIDFILKNLIGEEGAFHIYNDNTQEARMDGQLEDNLWAGMAFLEGYMVTSESKYIPATEYLKVATALADFSIKRLFDTKLGGFFKRNSNSLNFYPPEELFLDDKVL